MGIESGKITAKILKNNAPGYCPRKTPGAVEFDKDSDFGAAREWPSDEGRVVMRCTAAVNGNYLGRKAVRPAFSGDGFNPGTMHKACEFCTVSKGDLYEASTGQSQNKGVEQDVIEDKKWILLKRLMDRQHERRMQPCQTSSKNK